MTIVEDWSGKSLHVKHLCVFQRIAHVYIPNEQGVDVDRKIPKCIFIGYSDEGKVFWFYDPMLR